jgi:hypothetical protein
MKKRELRNAAKKRRKLVHHVSPAGLRKKKRLAKKAKNRYR